MHKLFRLLFLLLPVCALASASTMLSQERGDEGNLLTLREAVRLALARAPEMHLAQVEASKAGEALRETRSLRLPQVVTGSGLAYNNGFPLSIEGSAPSILELGMSQTILNKKNNNLIREAEEGSHISEASMDAVRNDLVAKTALLYSELHRTLLTLPILNAQREAASRSQQATEALYQAGRARALDVTRSIIQTANLEQQILVVHERIRVAESGLRELTGIPGEQPFRTEAPQIATELFSIPVDDLYKKALEINPEVRQAEFSLRARQYHVEAEKGERYPQFTIVSQYALFSRANNYQDYFSRFTRNNYILGLSIQLPLFDGFRASARVAQSNQEAEAAQLRLERIQSDLKASLERSSSDLHIANGATRLAHLEVGEYEENLKMSETLLEAGRIDPAELENARGQMLGKQIAAEEAERTLFERQVALLQASGFLASIF
jgi:outer membrane protein TolC